MTQYGFYFDSSRCTGCKTCELVCKDYHDLGPDILFRRIYDFEGGSWEKTSEGAWNKTAIQLPSGDLLQPLRQRRLRGNAPPEPCRRTRRPAW